MGFEMFSYLKIWLADDDSKVLYILTLILIANIIDFLLGFINAKFNTKVNFESSRAIYGIARKMTLFILCIYFIPVALLIPEPFDVSALYVLYIGYLVSEINSILSHLRMTEDGKSDQTEFFIDFIQKLIKGGEKK